jgi:hypothetical protein
MCGYLTGYVVAVFIVHTICFYAGGFLEFPLAQETEIIHVIPHSLFVALKLGSHGVK